MRVKICGLTRLEDAELAVDLGAAAIVRMLPPFVTAVGVFVDQTEERVEEVAAHVGLGAVQLHGNEAPAYCRRLRHRVIRAVGLQDEMTLESLAVWPPAVTLLVDAHDPERRGGTGRTVNWELAARIASARPTILAGGLRPENVGKAIAAVRPYAIDVSSGVEARPGVKDPARMRAFFEAVEAKDVT